MPDIRRARLQQHLRIHTGRVFGNLPDQRVGENVLCDGDGDGAPKGVEEDGHGVAGWHVLFGEYHLDGDEGDLHARAGTAAGEDF